MRSRIQIASGLLAGFLLLTIPLAAQVEYGDVSMNLNGILSAGYNGSYGNLIDSAHAMNFGGSGTLSGSYYDPNFLSFNLTPYANQSRANSNYRSISNASGFDFSSGIFGGSSFPGSINFSKSYNSDGNFGIPGVTDFTTRANNSSFGLNWSERLPEYPTLTFGYQQGTSDYSIYGTDENGNSHHHSFNLNSNYRLQGFNLSGYYTQGASESLIPSAVSGTTAAETANADDNGYGFAVSHTLPLRGYISSSFNRSNINSDYLGYSFNGTIDTYNAAVSTQPTNKLHLSLSGNYTDNFAGVLYQSLVTADNPLLLSNGQSSHATDLLGSASYSFLSNLQGQVYADRRDQTFLGQSFGATAYGAQVNYGHELFGGAINTSFALIDNTVDNSDSNTLGFTASVGYNRRVGDWFISGHLTYAQNVQTLLVTLTNSYYNYSVNVRRRFTRHLVWSAGAGFSNTGLTDRPDTGNSSQSFSTGISYGRWLGVNGSYSRSNGHGLITASGISPVPLPPIVPDNLLVLYGGRSYGFSVSTMPIRHLTLSAGYSDGRTDTANAGLASFNSINQWNTLFDYQFRKMHFVGGYARLQQTFSISPILPQQVSSFYVGVNRWFNFF